MKKAYFIIFASVAIGCRQKEQVNIVSPIVEQKIDLSHLPSYCDPKTYTILKVGDKYFIRLIGGLVLDDSYNSASEAQEEINKSASISYERFIKSGGVEY